MSAAFLVQQEDQPIVGWRGGGTFTQVLAAAASGGGLGVGRFRAHHGDATAYHLHTREDEVFLLLQGSALLWCDDDELELNAGGVVFLPRNLPHGYRITSPTADMLMICTPG